ncbi:hypothetical protein ACTHGU_17645 [Chitinophagaceae bacterium MMS25-I14]
MKQLLRNNKLSAYVIFLFCLTLLVRIVLVFYYKSNAGGVDQNVIYGIQRIIAGQPLYQDPTKVPFAIMQYTPLYYSLMAGFCRLLHITTADVQAIYIVTKAFSLLCNLATILLAAAATSAWTRNYRRSLVYALPVIMILTVHYLGRVDSLQLLFFMLTIYLFLRYIRKPGLLLLFASALTTACCILTKQSGILLPLIICFYLAFIMGRWLHAFFYGIVSVACFGGLLYLLINGDLLSFYQNAYLGLKNGFDYSYPITIFTSQFYYDLIPCYFLGFILFGFLYKRTDSVSEANHFLACAMIFSFFFAVITGLKIGSSNNYFTEFLLFLLLLLPGLKDMDFANRRLFRIGKKNVLVSGFAGFCFVVLISSKAIGQFSAVFVERWFKNEKQLYTSGEELRHYFDQELKLKPGQYVYFSTREFLDNIFFGYSIMPNKDVTSQVYLTNPQTIDQSGFIDHMNDGLVSYVVTKSEKEELNINDVELPFVHFDEAKFQKLGKIAGYTVYRFKGN